MQKLKNLIKMRLILIVFLSIFLLLVPVFSSVTPTFANALTPEIELGHSIQITRGGLIIVNDTISLQNNDLEPITSFNIGFHKDLAKNLDSATASTAFGEKLTIRKESVDYMTDIYWMSINLPEAIEQNESFIFSASFAFSKLINYTISEPTVYTAIFPEYPALQFEAASCMVEINIPTETTLNMSSWGNSTTYLKSPLEENLNQTAFVSFIGTIQYVEGTFLWRDIVIESWGITRSYDKYEIRNIGIYELQGIECPLPDNASEVTAYDDFGPLENVEKEVDGKKYAVVESRYPLRGEENLIQVHDSYSFTIQYRLETSEFTTGLTSLTSHQIEIEAFPCPDWMVENFELKVTFPEGGEYTQASPPPAETSQNLYTQSITYTTTNVTCLNKYPITINYDYNTLWSAFRPTLWIGLATIAVGGVAFLRKGKAPKPTPLPSTDTEVIRSYIEVCTERMGLWRELEDLENDLDNRRIRRKGYNRRRRILRQRLSTLNKEVANYENRVNRQGDDYTELTKRLREAESEVRTTHTEIDRLKNRRQRSRLSQNAYRRLRDACDERLQKARGVIEEVILELRRLAS
jgi:hypothetical protein